MKKLSLLNIFFFTVFFAISQEAIKLQNGASITIQNGVELSLQGGLTLENGSSLQNNGIISLKNNVVSNISNWTDNSILGALTGNGIVIFNSTHPQQFTGPTSFYTVYVNTDQLTINNNLSISNLLKLINGKITTSNFVVMLVNSAALSLENDATNINYGNSWINGNFQRSIASNTSSYDFPVGNATRSNLLKFLNNNLAGPTSLTASFIPKPGTDAGLNVTENGNTYTAVNNGGVWKLIPNSSPTGGNYALHLYFNGFTGLADNSFGMLRRPDASSNAADWMVPTGSLLPPLNGTGRKLSDGFAKRYNISDFSQFGIGQFTLATPCEITGQSAVCIASSNNIYSAPAGMTTYLWNVTGNAGINGLNTLATVNISTGAGPGSFTITLITSLNGVATQCTKTVTISSTPTCEIFGPDELCFSPTTTTQYSGPGNMLTYSWIPTPGLTILGSNTSSSVNVMTTGPGPQMLTLNSTGVGGCTSQCTKLVNVKPIPPCSITGASNVTASTPNNQYSAPANLSSYNWSIAGNGNIIGSNTGSSVNVTAGAAGNFTLTLTTTLNGCSLTCNKVVTVSPVFTYACNITGESQVCAGSSEIFKAPANLVSYNWVVSGNGTITGSNTDSSVTIEAGTAGSYTITLQTMLNGLACSSTKTVTIFECVNACSYSQGFYGNQKGQGCYNNSGISYNSTIHMLAAFGITSSQVFGNVANRRFFTLYRTDITSGNIYKMLPGGGPPKSIDVDNKPPFDGAYYNDQTTWSLVPLQSSGPQKGKIRNIFLAQTITLWFNIRNSNALAGISLVDDTLVTQSTAGCGNNNLVGNPTKYGLPHSVIVYLNGGNGYPPTVQGLFNLANDVLGGVVTNISASSVNDAVDVINNAFDGCKVLVGTIPYSNVLVRTDDLIVKGVYQKTVSEKLKVIAYPNPYEDRFQLLISSWLDGMAKIEFFSLTGQKIYEMSLLVYSKRNNTVLYSGPAQSSNVIYKVIIGDQMATGIVIHPH